MLQSKLFLQNKEYTRLEATSIVYDYLKTVADEEEETEIHRAAVLKDLYDCRTCVNKIAQVYLKGIIYPESSEVFGGSQVLSAGELADIEERVLYPDKREPVFTVENEEAVKISLDALTIINDIAVIDVRTPSEFEKNHFKGAVNIPLSKYVLNPTGVVCNKYSKIAFICDKGANASIAAECAVKAGFKQVFYSSYTEE